MSLPAEALQDPIAEGPLPERGASSYDIMSLTAPLLPARGINPTERNRIILARLIFNQGLVGDNLATWSNLRFLYESRGRELPSSFFDRLRLEAFLAASLSERRGDNSRLEKYRMFGEAVDPKWFNESLGEEENFTRTTLEETFPQTQEDRYGYYSKDKYGNKWRKPVRSGSHGGIIFDSSSEAMRRAKGRAWKPARKVPSA